MKIINLIIGSAFTWFGFEKLTADPPENIGWLLLLVGVITFISAFSSSKGNGSSWGDGGGSGWNDSSGGDCGGGGD